MLKVLGWIKNINCFYFEFVFHLLTEVLKKHMYYFSKYIEVRIPQFNKSLLNISANLKRTMIWVVLSLLLNSCSPKIFLGAS